MWEKEDSTDLFIGNLSLYTTEEKLETYFSKFGNVLSVKVCTHPENGKSKRFGFLTFKDPEVIPGLMRFPRHSLDGKTLEIRYASKSIAHGKRKSEPEECPVPPKKLPASEVKVFVGGVSQAAKVEDLRAFFSTFGPVTSAVLLPDYETGRHRGFGFVTFEKESDAETVCSARYHTIKMKKVECKKASPKTEATVKSLTANPYSPLPPPPVAPQLFDLNASEKGLLGEHPLQSLAPPSNGLFTTADGYLMATASSYNIYQQRPIEPIYINPFLTALPFQQSNAASFKMLKHRFISEPSLRYSPYSLQGRTPSYETGSHYPPAFITAAPTTHHYQQSFVPAQTTQDHQLN